MKKLLLTLMVAVVSSSAMAEWTKLDEADGCTRYIDLATISKTSNRLKVWENKVKMWFLEDCKTPQIRIDGSSNVLSAKIQREFNCKDKQQRTLALRRFSGKMGSGMIQSNTTPLGSYTISGKWSPIAPGSYNEPLWKVACGE